ncbi:MAG: family 43 glycosylhydrolase, partial [Defluviitaleaceae bacterium]|nr:family 43 glycosylhydrolase [Defluviitaleaceae bacterium]
NLRDWVCHGDIFHTTADRDHAADIDRDGKYLYAPDVVEKDGKYFLFAYIMDAKGCVAVSDRPEGPFSLVSEYKYGAGEDGYCDNGWFIDPGVLVDDDGRSYIFCGFKRSWAAELKQNMYEIIDKSYANHIISLDAPFSFFEACSPRKIGDTYYLIYSPQHCSRLVYATSDSPLGKYKFGGTIVDNGENYPGGNNHGSICQINSQWYIFYHRMTNGTIMSRRACVERIEILADGSIPQVEMTSLGFDKSLSPYEVIPAEIACVLTGGCIVTEKNIFSRAVIKITDGCVIGYKYFDFGDDFSSKTMQFFAKIRGMGIKSEIKIFLGDEKNFALNDTECLDRNSKTTTERIPAEGVECLDKNPETTTESIPAEGANCSEHSAINFGAHIGTCEIGLNDGVYSCEIKNVVGRHAVFLVAKSTNGGWFKEQFDGRHLFELEEFVFAK